MFYDIFSSFDDHHGTILNSFYLIWTTTLILSLSTILSFWPKNSKLTSILTLLPMITNDLISRTLMKILGGTKSLIMILFLNLILLNLAGLAPYIFSLTSHLALNLSLSLPIWTAIVLMSMTYDLGSFTAHLQPLGSPAPLNPFLCIIELVSLTVRPLTLAVRLTANLSTGHILMALLGVGFINSSHIILLLIITVGTFYFIFEMAVCFIQAYIFTLLPTLYTDEHPYNS